MKKDIPVPGIVTARRNVTRSFQISRKRNGGINKEKEIVSMLSIYRRIRNVAVAIKDRLDSGWRVWIERYLEAWEKRPLELVETRSLVLLAIAAKHYEKWPK